VRRLSLDERREASPAEDELRDQQHDHQRPRGGVERKDVLLNATRATTQPPRPPRASSRGEKRLECTDAGSARVRVVRAVRQTHVVGDDELGGWLMVRMASV
jgi:hypothetical protein